MANRVIEQGVHHIGMRSCNYEKTVRFYKEGLGFKTVLEWEWGDSGKACILDMGNGTCIEIGNDGEPELPPVGKFTHLALRTENIEKAYERALAAGGRSKVPPTYSDVIQARPEPWKLWFAYVIGFDNEEIEFIQTVSDSFSARADDEV